MKEILKQVLHSKAHVHIGKSGVTDAVLDQINKQFETRKMIKIKFLNFGAFNSIKDAAEFISKQVNAKVMDIRGKTCVLMSLKKRS